MSRAKKRKENRGSRRGEFLPGTESPLRPKRVYLIWSRQCGLYEPPFTSRGEAREFAREENRELRDDDMLDEETRVHALTAEVVS